MRLFDTDVLIAHLRGEARATALLVEVAADDEAACSALTTVELLGGMRSAERSAVRRLLGALHVLPVTEEIAALAGEQQRTFRRSHSTIGVVDHVIAATAQVHGAALVTLNTKHYPMLKGLRPAYTGVR